MTYFKNNLENLEIKLQNAKIENFEKFKKVETFYKQNYKQFINNFFKTDILGIKKTISSLFQLERFNGKDGKEALEIALEKGLKILPISIKKREQLKEKIIKLDLKQNIVYEILGKRTELSKNKNYPILESLFERKILDNSDLINIYGEYQKSGEIRLSLNNISKEKREIIKIYFYNLNSTNKEEKIENFRYENNSNIMKLEKKYPSNIVDGVVKYVGRNFFKMKPYKNNIESKKLRLKRTFKIALLKLLKIKYSGFNIDVLIKKIDSMQDFESMFKLLMKLIDIIPENNKLIEKFSLKEEIDEVDGIITEAESNKEKILKSEEATIKVCKIIDKTDKKINKKVLEKILDEDTDIIGNEIKIRKNKDGKNNLSSNKEINKKGKIINGHFYENKEESEDDNNSLNLTQEELLKIYKQLKIEFSELEKKKQEIFSSGKFEKLDETNNEILKIMFKIDKIEKLIKF